MIKKYGKTKPEADAEKSLACRQIIKEINNFGVDEYQKLHLIRLLALELENNESMKKIIKTITEIKEYSINNEQQDLIGL